MNETEERKYCAREVEELTALIDSLIGLANLIGNRIDRLRRAVATTTDKPKPISHS